MKAPADKVTPDLLPEFDLAGERPRKPTAKELAAARARRYKERHNVKAFTVQLPVDLVARIDAFVANPKKGKGRTKSQIIEKLIETQLLRDR